MDCIDVDRRVTPSPQSIPKPMPQLGTRFGEIDPSDLWETTVDRPDNLIPTKFRFDVGKYRSINDLQPTLVVTIRQGVPSIVIRNSLSQRIVFVRHVVDPV